ncbi:MAG: alpha/beta hydrolase [Chloroflexi bacterium]|nr:alpha/beta hydrolase [Chloroflexota bacterium]
MNTSYSPDWAAQAVSREIAAGDATLFVRQWGNTGPDVVLIHGGPDWDHSYFFPFMLPLTAHCRLTTFDLRGCGHSTRYGRPECYSLDRAVDDLALLLQHLDLTQVTLLGFSFGGRVALRLVDRYPALAARLILASTTAYEDYQDDLEAWDEYQQRHPPAKQAATRLIWASTTLTGEQKTRALALESAYLDIYDLHLLPLVRDVMQHIAFSGEWMSAWQAGALRGVQHADYGRRLSELGIPTLILHGEKDMRFPVSVARRLHACVPQSSLYVLPCAGHLAHIENTRAWNDAILQFLVRFNGTSIYPGAG